MSSFVERIELLRPEVIVEAYDRWGRLVRGVRRESKCFVENFVNALYGMLTDEVVKFTRPDGSVYETKMACAETLYADSGTYAHSFRSYPLVVGTGADVDTHGIIVGTGTTPPSNTDYWLESQIPQGTGDGQLDHDAVEVSAVTEDTTNNVAYFDVRRKFYNVGSVDIDVSELGLAAWIAVVCKDARAGTCVEMETRALLIRDVLDTPVTVPASGTLTVTYRLKAAAPLVGNFMKWLRAFMSTEDTEATAQDGTTITLKGHIPTTNKYSTERYTGPNLQMYVEAGEGDDSYGIIIGSSTTTEAVTDYALKSKLGEAVMHHYAVEPGGIEDLTDKWRIKFTRKFVNVCGESRSVGELGLVSWQRYYMKDDNYGVIYDVSNKVLVFRKAITAVTVKPDQVLTVTIYISVPK